jgi:hypothetical protein
MQALTMSFILGPYGLRNSYLTLHFCLTKLKELSLFRKGSEFLETVKKSSIGLIRPHTQEDYMWWLKNLGYLISLAYKYYRCGSRVSLNVGKTEI